MTSPRIHFWDLADPRPVYACGSSPRQGRNNHVIARHDSRDDLTRFLRRTDACPRCRSALLALSPAKNRSRT